MDLESRLRSLLDDARAGSGPLVFLTGAGISAESGIPTFRGPEGYWTVGSREYRPEELATYEAFTRMPDEVWAWYLYRRGVCRAARPNPAHLALVGLEKALGERFLLVTQNVDGLHLRAGHTPARVLQIHGNIDHCRCEDEYPRTRPIPESIPVDWPKARKLGAEDRRALTMCDGKLARPHVLWFDESYDEPLFRFESAMRAAHDASLLVVVGTSGATTLPSRMVQVAAMRGIALVVINQDESPFTQAARASARGLALIGAAGEWMPRVAAALSS